MKVLFYNWVDYLDDEKRGGGVSIYQRNTIRELSKQDDLDCTFISSGISHDLLSNEPRWEKIKHGPTENKNNRYEIINSEVLSPSHHSFGQESQVTAPRTAETFFDFIRKKGPFDVVHFNNLEGLPAQALNLKEEWPETRVIFSLHNYYPICPQVNLWHQERENCLDYDMGKKCLQCLPHQHDVQIISRANAVAFNLKKAGIRPGSKLFDKGFSPAMRLAGKFVRIYSRTFKRKTTNSTDTKKLLKRVEPAHQKFIRRRTDMISLINTHCDRVLCVSQRVGEVAKRYGIAPSLVQTSYIGTQHAEKFTQTEPKDTLVKDDGTLTIAYLGYMRQDKGFFFLLKALEEMPESLAQKINIVICSRLINQETMDWITNISSKFASMMFADGYAHDELDELLADVDLGIVPVLWEDNLPQVAIEIHARHIPLLTSDLGGAQELGNTPEFVFKAGDIKSFAQKLKNIVDGKTSLKKYWKNAMAPYSMQDHIDELLDVYKAPARPISLLKGKPAPQKKTERA